MNFARTGALAALFLSGHAALASQTGVPLVHRSAPTDEASAPSRLVPGDAALPASLVATPEGRVTLDFGRPDAEPGRYVYVATRFICLGGFAARVSPERPLGSVAAWFKGQALSPRAGGTIEFVADNGNRAEAADLVLRFERGADRSVAVELEIRAWDFQNQVVLDQVPFVMTYALAYLPSVYPGDILVPAVARAEGRFGPVRTDVSFVNTSGADLSVAMTFLPGDGVSASNTLSFDVPARSQRRISDVVRSVFPRGSVAPLEGILAVHGYVPANEGDFVAETYYERAEGGRIATRLPTYSSFSTRASSRLLSFTTEGNPKLILFSSRPYSTGPLQPRTATLRFRREDGGEQAETVGLWNGRYGITRVPGVDGRDDLTTLESDDPFLHAVLISTDPVTGSTRILASE